MKQSVRHKESSITDRCGSGVTSEEIEGIEEIEEMAWLHFWTGELRPILKRPELEWE